MTDSIEAAWAALHAALEGREPLKRSAGYIERSDRVFAANKRPADVEAWAEALAASVAELKD